MPGVFCRALGLQLVLLTAPSGLAAQATEPSEPASAQATPTAAAEAEARALFTAGQAAFAEGRFDHAAEYFARAYELSRRPVLLYNLGTAYDRLRRDAEALAAFERYLQELPDAPDAVAINARIAVLRESVRRSTPVEQADPADTEHPEPEATTPAPLAASEAPASDAPASDVPGPGPWIVLGVGGAAVVAGAVLLGLAAADVATVEGVTRESGTAWSDVEAAYGRSETESIAGAVLLGVGGAAAVAGVVWVVAGSSSARVEVVPSAGGGVVRGSF